MLKERRSRPRSAPVATTADGTAKPAIAKMMPTIPAKLGDAKVLAKSDEDLKEVIIKGKGKMRPVAGVTEKQAADIVAFVRTLK